LAEEDPDIIVVQEGWGHWRTMLLGMGPRYAVHAGCRYDSDCNVVILSRFRLVELLAPSADGVAAVRLAIPADLGGGTVDVLGVHLSRATSESIACEQEQTVDAIAHQLGARSIAAGDFNATPWSRTLDKMDLAIGLSRQTHFVFTWPTPARSFTRWRIRSPLALAPIDHVYAGAGWDLVEVRRGPDIGSDHYPVIATFSLPAAPQHRQPP
jgi:endonuclease/exonuclease/phosphatase (EEP) superfamily protein YafD